MNKTILLVACSFFSALVTAQDPCDEVSILDVYIDPLNPEQLIISVENTGPEIFSYPGFRAYNSDLELVGEEMVNFFGISGVQQFFMVHNLGLLQPGEEVELTLELWTGFYEELACTWTVTEALIPEDECAEVFVYFAHWNSSDPGDPLIYEIYDESNQLVVSGGLDLPAGAAYIEVPLCLPLGCYHAIMTTSDAMISSEIAMGMGPHYTVEPNTAIVATSEVGDVILELDFGIWTTCLVDHITVSSKDAIQVWPNPTGSRLNVAGLKPNSQVQLYDNAGRLVMNERFIGTLDLENLKSGLYTLRGQNVEGSVVVRIVKE